MSNSEKQIKLAEAMELGRIRPPYQQRNESFVRIPLANGTDRKFDPFTDANDDYAVLEWMRKIFTTKQMRQACDELGMMWQRYQDESPIEGELPYSWFRKTGDYARAALKVIE